MSRQLPPSALLLLSALVLVVAACGGNGGTAGEVPTGGAGDGEGAADAYVEQVRAADGAIRGAGEQLSAGTTTEALEEVRTELEETVRRVEQATPPYDLLPEHQRLAQALWDAVDAAQTISDAGGDDVAAGDLAPVVEQLREADEAIAAMEEKGYDVRQRT